MRNQDVERLLRESRELTPSEDLRNRVLSAQTAQKVEETVEIVAERSIRPSFALRRMVPAAAAVLLMITAVLSSIGMYRTEYDAVYIDINPSVELSVNRFSRIIGVTYLNADAEACFSDVSLENMRAQDGMTVILEELDKDGYLDHGELYIGVSGKNTRQAEKLLEKLESDVEKTQTEKGYSVSVHGKSISAEEKQVAKELGISPTKYHMIGEIMAQDGSLNPQELQNMNMKELRELLGEKEKEQGNDKKDHATENGQHGNPSEDKGKNTEKSNDKNTGKANGKDTQTSEASADTTLVTTGKGKSENKANGKENGQNSAQTSDTGTEKVTGKDKKAS